MNIHTLDKATIINELNVGAGINTAVNQGRRADFALLVSMFSNDVRDNTPVEEVEQKVTSDDLLREQFELATPQTLRSNQDTYARSAKQAELFHASSIVSSRLSHGLNPDALAYLPEQTHDLPEEVYHNLSGHERRRLAEPKTQASIPQDIYKQMAAARLSNQMQLSA